MTHQDRRDTGRVRRGRRWLAVAATFAYAWIATPEEPFSLHGRLAIGLVGIVAVAVALIGGHHRRRELGPFDLGGTRLASLAVWVILLAVAAVFQLSIFFFTESREIYPTLSSLMNLALEPYAVRAAALAAWLWLGWFLMGRR